MKRPHRAAHRIAWIVLTVLVAIGFTLALVQRKPQKKSAQSSFLHASYPPVTSEEQVR